jgi:cyclophilin family peptidyl-prolyl cis-trans isomerase
VSSPHRLRVLPSSLLLAAALVTDAKATPPIAPVITAGSWSNNATISLTWEDKSTDETGFYVVYRFNGGDYSIAPSGTLPANRKTYSLNLDDSWHVCDFYFEWAVVAYKTAAGGGEEYGWSEPLGMLPPPPTGTTACPPILRTPTFQSAMLDEPYTKQLSVVRRTNSTGVPLAFSSGFTAVGLPPGMTITPGGLLMWIPAATGRNFTFTVTATESGFTLPVKTMKITVFRHVPALEGPVNGTPLTNRTLHRNAAPVQVDLGAHFSDPDVSAATRIVFNTGTMDFVYYPTAAPATVANFQGYVTRGDYVNSIIHRSIPGFVLQGGGFKAAAGAPEVTKGNTINNEPEITNARGTVAMAKLGNNPNSATSEYFISLADNALNLNNQNEGFTVFARVAGNGMAVADAIAQLSRKNFSSTKGALTDCPVTDPPPAAFDPASLVKIVSAAPVNPLSYLAESSDTAVCGAAATGGQLTLTPLANGNATITVTAKDLDNQTIVKTFNVVVEEHLSDWLTAQQFPNAEDATATANPDGDAAENVMEFALMTDPKTANPPALPQSGIVMEGANRYLTLSFPVRKHAGSGFAYTVEAGDGSGAWTPVWTLAQGFAHAQVVSSTAETDRTNVTIKDTVAIAAGGRRFVRLKVTDTPPAP